MTRRTRGILGAVALLALLGPLLVDVLWVSDEERVEAALAGIEAALEARDADRLQEWLATEVEVVGDVPGLRRRLPLVEGIRVLFAGELQALAIEREESIVEFLGDGHARVRIGGVIHVDFGGFRGPGRFEADVELRRGADDRFRLEKVTRVEVKPLFG